MTRHHLIPTMLVLFALFGAAIAAAATSPPAAWTTGGLQVGCQYGESVASAGDVNGDGFKDVIVGAPSWNETAGSVIYSGCGKVWLYYGSASGLSTTAAWSFVGPTNNSNINGNLGANGAICCAGDVNNDGYDDVLLGAPGYDIGAATSNEGIVYLFLGSATGLSATPATTIVGAAGSRFGTSVCGRGKVNSDNYADVIVGAYLHSGTVASGGAAFVYAGSASGLNTTPVWQAEGAQATCWFGHSVAFMDANGDTWSDVVVGAHLYDVTGTGPTAASNQGIICMWYGSAAGINAGVNGLPTNTSWRAEGNAGNCYLGYSVANAGKVNSGPYDDLVVGSFGYANTESQEGGVFVWYGAANGMNGGVAGTVTNAGFKGESNQASAFLGWSVGGAGDVNGDGFADIIAGGYGWDGTIGTFQGIAIVWVGSASGIVQLTGTLGSPTPSYHLWEGATSGAYSGAAVAMAGDVNGDGASEMIVGARTDEINTIYLDEGVARVYQGAGARTVSFTAATATVAEASGTMMVTVTLAPASSSTVTVQWATANGTAAAPGDFTAASGTVTFPANNTSQTFSVAILNDTVDENDEVFTIVLSAPTGASLGVVSTLTVTITDDDAPPSVSFAAAAVSTPESGGPPLLLAVLSAASERTITVDVTAAPGTASSPADYVFAPVTLTFNAGTTTQTFTVGVVDDALNEDDETVSLAVASPANVTIGAPSGCVLTIQDDDAAPTLTLTAGGLSLATIAENAGPLLLTLTLSGASGRSVIVALTATDGTALAGQDYSATIADTTFAAGQTVKTAQVTIINDSVYEASAEGFTVALGNLTNVGSGSPNLLFVTITDDDPPPATAPVFTSTAPTTASVGVAFSYTVTFTGTPQPTLTPNALPSWLTLSAVTAGTAANTWQATLSGTPAVKHVGTVPTITLTAANTQSSVQQAVNLTVAAPPGGVEDANLSGGVNVQDVQLVVNLILNTATPGYALQGDVNGDGNVTVSDVQKVVNKILHP